MSDVWPCKPCVVERLEGWCNLPYLYDLLITPCTYTYSTLYKKDINLTGGYLRVAQRTELRGQTPIQVKGVVRWKLFDCRNITEVSCNTSFFFSVVFCAHYSSNQGTNLNYILPQQKTTTKTFPIASQEGDDSDPSPRSTELPLARLSQATGELPGCHACAGSDAGPLPQHHYNHRHTPENLDNLPACSLLKETMVRLQHSGAQVKMNREVMAYCTHYWDHH